MSQLFHTSPSLFLRPLFFFFFLVFARSINGAVLDNQTFPNCPVYICDGVTISYPFWRQDETTSSQLQYCGYPQFGINCSTGANPIIRLPGDPYYVKGIDYESHNISLVDIDVAGQSCPRVRHRIDIQSLPLNFTAGLNVNLSFHFGCTEIPPFATPIPCLSHGPKNQSCVYVEGTETEEFNWNDYCSDQVSTTVLSEAINHQGGNSLDKQFSSALSGGFMLNWGTAEDCGKCEASGGRCGNNTQTSRFNCFCKDGTSTKVDCGGRSTFARKIGIGIGVAVTTIGLVIIVLVCCIIGYFKKISFGLSRGIFQRRTANDRNVEAFIMEYALLTPKRYRYSEIKRMTNSFHDKLGQGGFGSVFKGRLPGGRIVAVKVLNSSKGNGEEFINEVASIGRTSHVNIVTLLGFCYEGRRRALIYEYMSNGSLDNFIYGNDRVEGSHRLGVDRLYEVAVGIARGLQYLHRGCNTRILHSDIKPQNILLDEDFCPKIADFGLAKLYSRKESIVSILEARGTIGYIAPEVFSRNFGAVSHKSDVYSYGMVVIEMVGGRNDARVGLSAHSSEVYFPHWIYKHLELEENFRLEGLASPEENEVARKMIIVGLWCIQTNPSQRPSIDEVIEMFEGSMESLKVPPKPFLHSPPRSPKTTSTNTSITIVDNMSM